MNEPDKQTIMEAIASAVEFLLNVARDLQRPQWYAFVPRPESGKTDYGVVIALTGTKEEIQIALDTVHNIQKRRKQQAIAANN